MRTTQANRIATFGRVLGFAALYPGDIPAASKADKLLTLIRDAETDATAGGTDQSSSGGAARGGTQTKADFYDELYEDLQALNRTAKAIAADEVPGLDEKFRMPRSPSYKAVLTAARAFLKDATPLKAEFIEYELPADFLEDLEDDIEAFEKAEDDQGDGRTQQVGATRSIAEAVAAGAAALRKLDALMRNKYRASPARLAEWLTASHTERAPRKAKAKAAVG
ncbi:MAG: hypothetical protein ABIT37_23175 [Luteolibacter sp.]